MNCHDFWVSHICIYNGVFKDIFAYQNKRIAYNLEPRQYNEKNVAISYFYQRK